jgi:hypothetical protein
VPGLGQAEGDISTETVPLSSRSRSSLEEDVSIETVPLSGKSRSSLEKDIPTETVPLSDKSRSSLEGEFTYHEGVLEIARKKWRSARDGSIPSYMYQIYSLAHYTYNTYTAFITASL